ncbi:AraC family transcriptional regulator [Paraburkholderia pallida]|uniref:AraC family transcriptional regulator n=1 Tax=Paraburkholderia pallida TaxID=2547399 RepID=A0A4P7CYE8_9BURK|nr:AraC family transcriptional regulator [Paraburkholderia pallida]QBR01319.1 AraC family transcriptional regulator [Paraburkholderia pallida]
MESEKGTVSVVLVEETLNLARRGGLDTGPLLEAAGIAPAVLASPRSRITSEQYGTLWNGIARAMDDEFFGQDSHPMRSGGFIAMTRTALTAQTGGRALASAVGFMRLVLDDIFVRVSAKDKSVRLEFVHSKHKQAPSMFAYATYFLLVYGLVCWLVGNRISVLRACFQCSEPAAVDEYKLLFCEDMTFGQDTTYVDLTDDFIDLPVVQTKNSVKAFLRDAPGNFIVKYRNPDSLAARVRRLLRENPAEQWPSSSELAKHFRLSEATMRRRLRTEGQTYLSIKDHVRRDFAIGALQGSDRPIGLIAQELGFAEPSAFYRAFQKWTGLRPSDYRSEKHKLAK